MGPVGCSGQGPSLQPGEAAPAPGLPLGPQDCLHLQWVCPLSPSAGACLSCSPRTVVRSVTLSVTLLLPFPPKPPIWKEHTNYREEHPLTYLGRVLSALCHQQENRGLESWGASPSSQGPGCEAQAGSSRQPSDPIVLGSQYSGCLGGPPSSSRS